MNDLKLNHIYVYLIVISIFASCDNNGLNDSEDFNNISDNNFKSIDFELTTKLTVDRTTDRISNSFLNKGVVKIEVSNENDYNIYTPLTVKNFYLDDVDLNLGDFSLIVDGQFAYLENQPNFMMSYVGDKLYIISDDFEGVVQETEFDIFDTTLKKIALVILNEIVETDRNKTPILQPVDFDNVEDDYNPTSHYEPTHCSFMGTRTYFYYGNTRSVAIANATYERELAEILHELSQNSGFGNACAPFGGIDSACIYGDFGCVASYSVCCD